MKLDDKQKHIFLKCIEELNELAVELIQSVNKENKNNWGKIFDEIEDVEKYIKLLKNIKKINDQIFIDFSCNITYIQKMNLPSDPMFYFTFLIVFVFLLDLTLMFLKK